MKLVQDWKSFWKWFSVQSMAAAATATVAWSALPEDLRSAAPHWLITALVVAILVLGIIGRLVEQKK